MGRGRIRQTQEKNERKDKSGRNKIMRVLKIINNCRKYRIQISSQAQNIERSYNMLSINPNASVTT